MSPPKRTHPALRNLKIKMAIFRVQPFQNLNFRKLRQSFKSILPKAVKYSSQRENNSSDFT